jgi:PGF-pre-PGF domain-containing protein
LIAISVTFANALSGISLTASKIAAPPSDAPAAPGIPFAYVKVEKNGFKDSDLSSTTLEFKVEKAWIDENGIDPAKVSAYRLENNTWTMLTTTKSTEDDKYIYYSAVSPSGLSIFAISGEKKTVAPPSEEKPPAAGETAKPSADYTWLGLLAIVIVAAGAGYYLLSKKGGKGKKAK